jgi:hypothetical protein
MELLNTKEVFLVQTWYKLFEVFLSFVLGWIWSLLKFNCVFHWLDKYKLFYIKTEQECIGLFHFVKFNYFFMYFVSGVLICHNPFTERI